MKKRLFAIGMKKWVELRVADEPPKREASSFSKEVEVPTYSYYHTVKKRIRFNVVIYEGGKVLCTIPRQKWERNTSLKVRKGKMVEVSDTWKHCFLDKSWRRRNLSW